MWQDTGVAMTKRRAVLLGAMFASITCGDGTNPPQPVASSLLITGGNNQAAEAGQALPDSLTVVARSADNTPVAGVSVTWTVTSGAGSVSPATSVTNANGVAQTRRTLGPGAGAQGTSAIITGASAEFTSLARIDGAVNLGNRTIGPLTDTTLGTNDQPLVVMVTDENNVPVPGILVLWTAGGGGSVSAAAQLTDAGGESIVQFTYGPAAGAQTARASVPGLVGSPIDFTLNATAGNAAAITKSGGDDLTVVTGGQVIHTVRAEDARGNPKNGVLIQWAVATGGGSITPAQNFTGSNGTAQATRTLGAAAGAQTVTATAPDITGSPSVTFTTTAVAPGATAQVQVADNFFSPQQVNISVGGSVQWTWAAGASTHNVTFAGTAGAPPGIGNMSSGSETRTFTAAGTFNYTCSIHGSAMSGAVTVTP